MITEMTLVLAVNSMIAADSSRIVSMKMKHQAVMMPERSSGAAYELGRQFTVRSTNAACTADAACIWLGFDPAARRYYALPWLSADNGASD